MSREDLEARKQPGPPANRAELGSAETPAGAEDVEGTDPSAGADGVRGEDEAHIALEADEVLPAEDAEEPSAAVPSEGEEASRATRLPAPAPPRDVATTDALTAYMAELRHHAPITREEEHELAVRWVEEGDVEAARRLVLSNLRLVVKIAMEYRRAWTNTLDLIQEGNVGLMEAVQRYDPYQGVKVSSYAVYWIRAYILKYILDNMRSVRLGTTRAQRKLFFRLNKEKRELELQGYEVEPRLLAERLEVSEHDVIEMEATLSRGDVSMDAPIRSDEDGGATRGDFFTSGGESAETQVGDGEIKRVFLEQVGAFAEELDERDKIILEERVLADPAKTLAELGEEFGVSRERVRQLEARIVSRLRDYMNENVVDFEYYAPSKE